MFHVAAINVRISRRGLGLSEWGPHFYVDDFQGSQSSAMGGAFSSQSNSNILYFDIFPAPAATPVGKIERHTALPNPAHELSHRARLLTYI